MTTLANSSGTTEMQEQAPPKTLLSLPPEILSHIARLIAPHGGYKVGTLRLVCSQLRDVATPILFNSILIDGDATSWDGLLALLYENEHGIGDRVSSVQYCSPKVFANLPVAFIRKFERLERLVITNPSSQRREPNSMLVGALRSMPKLRQLVLDHVPLPGREFWPAKLESLSLKSCSDISELYLDSTRRASGRIPFKSISVLDEDVSTATIFELLKAAMADVDHATFPWTEDGGDERYEVDSWVERTRPFSLRLVLLPLFQATRDSPPVTTMVRFLNWVGRGALQTLSLSIQHAFEVEDEVLSAFSDLCLPNLAQLSLSTNPFSYSERYAKELFDSNTYVPLIDFVSTFHLSPLKTLLLRGWFDITTTAKIATTPLPSLPVKHVHLYGLLGALRSTSITELRLENSEGHADDTVCVFRRYSGGGEWEKFVLIG